jgi:hypothetical protein
MMYVARALVRAVSRLISTPVPRNITSLHKICSYALPEETTFESSLVEVNGTLYLTSS